MNISNRGDWTTISLPTGHKATYDATKLRRLTANDQARMVGEIIQNALASLVVPAAPVFAPWPEPAVVKLPPINNPAFAEVPSGLSQDDDDHG